MQINASHQHFLVNHSNISTKNAWTLDNVMQVALRAFKSCKLMSFPVFEYNDQKFFVFCNLVNSDVNLSTLFFSFAPRFPSAPLKQKQNVLRSNIHCDIASRKVQKPRRTAISIFPTLILCAAALRIAPKFEFDETVEEHKWEWKKIDGM